MNDSLFGDPRHLALHPGIVQEKGAMLLTVALDGSEPRPAVGAPDTVLGGPRNMHCCESLMENMPWVWITFLSAKDTKLAQKVGPL
jgi:hypothetical protein